MNRTTARLALTVVGAGALTGLVAGVAQADEPAAAVPDAGAGQVTSGGLAPNYVLQGAPGAPIGDPVSSVFDVAAPAYGVLGALG